jgi:hypothetical protein
MGILGAREQSEPDLQLWAISVTNTQWGPNNLESVTLWVPWRGLESVIFTNPRAECNSSCEYAPLFRTNVSITGPVAMLIKFRVVQSANKKHSFHLETKRVVH